MDIVLSPDMDYRTSRDSFMRGIARRQAVFLAIALVLAAEKTWAEPECVPSAHRGEHTQAFDNSVEAIRAARGLPFVEVDVRGTVDDDLVLFHDRRLSSKNFQGDGRLIGRPFSSLSRRELAHIRYPDGSKILKLRKALREAMGLGTILMLDVKGNSARDFKRVMDDVHEAEGESQVVVQCQAIGILAYMRERYPKVAVLARAHSESDIEALLEYAPEFVQIDHDWSVSDLVARIHEGGARVVVKTLTVDTDAPNEWRRLCEAGVDVILTDRPRDLLAARMARGDNP